jgi:ComEC/Rec2-related protein
MIPTARSSGTAPPPARVRRPMLAVALAFLCGVALSARLPETHTPRPWLAAAAVLALAAAAGARRRWGPATLCAALVCAGVARDRVAAPGDAARDLAADGRGGREQREIVARVTDDPQAAGRTARGWTLWQFSADVEAVRAPASWRHARGSLRVRLALEPDSPPPAYGDRWHLSGVLDPELRRWSPARGFETRPGGARIRSAGGGNPLLRAVYARRRASRVALARGLERRPEAAAVIEALVLGYRSELPDAVREDFLRTGTLHVLAISGMHVGVILALMLPVLRWTGRPRPQWFWMLVPALALYTLGTGAAASAVRAWVMACVYWAALAAGRRPDPPTALAWAALLIVAVTPAQARAPGFLYSFAAVGALIAFAGPVAAFWRGRFAPEIETEPGRAPPLRRRIVAVFSGLLAASCVAWLATAPLAAYYGNVVSPMAIPGNLPMVPAAMVVLLTGVLSLLTGAVWPALGEVFNHANGWFATALIGLVRALARVPGGHAYVATPPGLLVAAVYGVYMSFLLLRGRARRVLIGAMAAILTAAGLRHAIDDRVTIEFPGQSLAPAVFVNLPGSRELLVNPGPAYRASRLVRHLRARGVDRLAALVLTQADAEHMGAAMEIATRIPTDEVWHVADPGRSRIHRDTLARFAEAGSPMPVARFAGQRGTLPGGVEWEILHPPAGVRYPRATDGAWVWRLGRGARAALFTGALGPAASAVLRAAPPDPGATLWVLDRDARAEDAALWPALGARIVLLRPPPAAGVARADPAFLDALPPEVLVRALDAEEGTRYELP